MGRAPGPRRTRARGAEDRFDEALLTAEDRRLLAAFERRRAGFERFLADSNILHHLRPCPACGLPTLDERGDHETCVVCLWEDGVGEADPNVVAPPNYVAMTQARVDAAALLAAFERTHGVPGSPAEVVRGIREFKRRLARGEVRVDREDFAANLRGILPAVRRGA